MGLISKLFGSGKTCGSVCVFDLIYAYKRIGTLWGPAPLSWEMKNCFDGYDFSGSWDRTVSLGLLECDNDTCALTDKGKDLLTKHDYIPFIVKHCKEFTFGHQSVFKLREKRPNLSKVDLLLKAVTERDFEVYYDYLSEEDVEEYYWHYFDMIRRYEKTDPLLK